MTGAVERALHIGIDGRELLGRPTGVGRYLLHVVREWLRDPLWPHRITMLVPADPPPDLAALSPRVAWHVAPSDASGTWWEQTTLAAALRIVAPDVFFAAGYTAPLSLPCPFVVAIYDVSFFAQPEGFRWRERVRRQWLTKRAARRARRIVTISAFSAAEIVRWLGVPTDTIRVAPPGAPPIDAASAPSTRAPTVLFVGSLFTRRHVPELIDGFAAARERVPGARLIIVGDNRTTPRIEPLAVAARCGVGDAVDWHAYVADEALGDLYRRARVFAFLSDYEGFGMTPMEALAHGVPPLLLDTPIAREVYGDGARFVTTARAEVGDAMATLLTDDRAYAALLERGRARLKQYSWAASAGTIARALEDAAERR